MGNGYPRSFICFAKHPREHDGEGEEDRPPTVHLPYVAGVSEQYELIAVLICYDQVFWKSVRLTDRFHLSCQKLLAIIAWWTRMYAISWF